MVYSLGNTPGLSTLEPPAPAPVYREPEEWELDQQAALEREQAPQPAIEPQYEQPAGPAFDMGEGAAPAPQPEAPQLGGGLANIGRAVIGALPQGGTATGLGGLGGSDLAMRNAGSALDLARTDLNPIDQQMKAVVGYPFGMAGRALDQLPDSVTGDTYTLPNGEQLGGGSYETGLRKIGESFVPNEAWEVALSAIPAAGRVKAGIEAGEFPLRTAGAAALEALVAAPRATRRATIRAAEEAGPAFSRLAREEVGSVGDPEDIARLAREQATKPGATQQAVSSPPVQATAATPGSVAEGAGPPPPPRAGQSPTGSEPPNPDDVVSRFTDVVQTIRKLPEQTEAIRKVERRTRVAASAAELEAGGYTPEAYAAARTQLAGEYSRAPFEALSEKFEPADIEVLRDKIRTADLLHFDRLNAETALKTVLDGRLNEIRPFELALLDKVYGSKFSFALAEKVAPPKFRDKVFEFWLSNILSGFMTQGRNIIGNLDTALRTPVEQLAAAALEQPIARLQGRAPERFFGEAPATLFGMARGFPEGMRGMVHVFKEGFNPSSAGRVEFRQRAIGGKLGQVVRLPLTGLEAFDTLFKAINFEGSRHSLALRMARTEGLKGRALSERVSDLVANTPDELFEAATKRTEANLFRDDPTAIGRALLKAREEFPALNFIIPFVKTPDRLVAYGIRRSPMGLLDIPMWKRLAAGNPEAVDELAQTLMGSTIAAGVAVMVATGMMDITAGAPINSAERDRFYREGKQPFAVKIPNLGWVQYNQIPAIAESLTMVAAATQAIREGGSPDEIIARTALTIGQSVADRSYMSGLADFLDAVIDPDRYAESFATRWITGFVPFSGGLRQTAQATDQTLRDPEGLAENVKAGIPGLSTTVKPRLDAFGEEIERTSPLSPIRVSGDHQSELDAELERVGKEVGFVGTKIGSKNLTDEEQFKYQQQAGRATKTALEELIASEEYKQLSPAAKYDEVEKTINKARADVRNTLLKEWADAGDMGAAESLFSSLGIKRPISENPDAWEKSKTAVAAFFADETRDKYAQQRYGKPYAEISDSQHGTITTDILKDNPKLNAWMVWWGQRESLYSEAAKTELANLVKQYGGGEGMGYTEQYRVTPELNRRTSDIEDLSGDLREGFDNATFGGNMQALGYGEVPKPDIQSAPIQLNAGADALAKMGLPRELVSIASLVEAKAGYGGYFPGTNTVQTSGRYGPRDPFTIIHESLHAFETGLTPQERVELKTLIAQNPPPVGGIPTTHHPPSDPSSPDPGTGVTAYFDYIFDPNYGYEGSTGVRTPAVPTPIMDFIRRLAPVVYERVRGPRAAIAR